MSSHPRRVLLGLALSLAAGCATTDHAVWVDTLPGSYAASASGFVIQGGDLLNVRVWNQDTMSGRFRVRDDGEISLLFINDVRAAGKTPQDLARELEGKLKDYLAKPVVSVSVEEQKPLVVSVLGEVAHPGSYTLTEGAGVLPAVASAGGLTEFAGRDKIYLLRQSSAGGPLKIRFSMQLLTGTTGLAPAFRLQSGDVVVVE